MQTATNRRRVRIGISVPMPVDDGFRAALMDAAFLWARRVADALCVLAAVPLSAAMIEVVSDD